MDVIYQQKSKEGRLVIQQKAYGLPRFVGALVEKGLAQELLLLRLLKMLIIALK